ncbi:MAG TPA: hypothetical protein VK041_00010 [Opitutales bacterium]|nr:hypothetical protein [Opitutales bacterium]
MKKIEIKLSQGVVAPLLDFVKTVRESLRDELVVGVDFSDSDPELQEIWREDLLEALGGDLTVFMALFDRDFFESGKIVIDEESADGVLRAAAALRLKIRTDFLTSVTDEVLEQGDVPFQEMSLQEQQAYGCYLFLATIQEVVIQSIN